jgi:hypothetical protein
MRILRYRPWWKRLITQSLLCVLYCAATAPQSPANRLLPAQGPTQSAADALDNTGVVAGANECPLPGAGSVVAQSVRPVPTELSGYRIVVGITLTSSLDSKTAKLGDPIQAVLKDDLCFGGKCYAVKGTQVLGHVSLYVAPRTLSQSVLTADRRFNSRAALQIKFDEIVDGTGAHIPIDGLLSQQRALFPGNNEPARELKIDKNGQIVKSEQVLSQKQTIVYTTARAATVVPLPVGLLFNIVGVPVIMGLAGGADPSFAYNKPIDATVKHRRLKAMFYAFITNLPGAFLVQSVVEKGNDILLKAGDELALSLCVKPDNDSNARPFTVADVQGTILPRSDGDRFVVFAGRGGEAGGQLVAETPAYDLTSAPGNAETIIRPNNGGLRLFPSAQTTNSATLNNRLFLGRTFDQSIYGSVGAPLIQPVTGGRRLVPFGPSF